MVLTVTTRIIGSGEHVKNTLCKRGASTVCIPLPALCASSSCDPRTSVPERRISQASGGDPICYWIPRLPWNDFLESRTSLKLERQLNPEVIKTHLTFRWMRTLGRLRCRTVYSKLAVGMKVCVD